jgi:multidrug efflux pump subunit AcrB
VPGLTAFITPVQNPFEPARLTTWATAGWRARITSASCWSALIASKVAVLMVFFASVALTAWMFVVIPKGFFPSEDIGQLQIASP